MTGATGFLGRYVMSILNSCGAELVQLSKSTGYDLRNESEVFQGILAADPDILVHLAGTVAGIGGNLGQPATLFRDNLQMGMNVIHASAVARIKLIMLGTAASYPAGTDEILDEANLWNGHPDSATAPFGIAKKALLTMMQAYRKQYRLHFGYLIPANIYGAGDSYKGIVSGVIPSLINRFIEAMEGEEEEVVCWGTGQAVRNFLFASDAAQAIAMACANLDDDLPVNLPGTEKTTIRETAELIAKHLGYEGKIVWDKTKPEGRRSIVLSGERAKEILGWEPKTKLEDGLRMAVRWAQEIYSSG